MAQDKLDRLETCRFQRTEDGQWELGLLLNEGGLGVLDWHGKIVSEIWDMKKMSLIVLDELKRFYEGWSRVFLPMQNTIAVDLETTKRKYIPLNEVYD